MKKTVKDLLNEWGLNEAKFQKGDAVYSKQTINVGSGIKIKKVKKGG